MTTYDIMDPCEIGELFGDRFRFLADWKIRRKMTNRYEKFITDIMVAAGKAFHHAHGYEVSYYARVSFWSKDLEITLYGNCRVKYVGSLGPRYADSYYYPNVRYHFKWDDTTASYKAIATHKNLRQKKGFEDMNSEIIQVFNTVLRTIPVRGVEEIKQDDPACRIEPDF